MSDRALCERCGLAIDPNKAGTMLEVVTWTRVRGRKSDRTGRATGGANTAIKAKPTGRVMCSPCWTLARFGVMPGQIPLFEG